MSRETRRAAEAARERPVEQNEQRRRARARTKRQWERRATIAMPRSSFEELEIRTSDGAVLRALVDDPPEGQKLRGTLVLAHALWSRKTAFGVRERPGLSSALVARGFRTIAFDFREHGDSAAPAGGAWGYDDLVRYDLPAVVEYARASGGSEQVLVVGHSLGGHVALAAQGTESTAVDAVVALGANVWLRQLEPSRLRWGAKLAVVRAAKALSSRASGIAEKVIRRAGVEAREDRWLHERLRMTTQGQWRSADGRDDYLASLARVRVPVAAVLGDRDRIHCHPSAGEAFVRRCAGAVTSFRAPVGHRDLVSSPRAWTIVLDAVEWAFAQAGH